MMILEDVTILSVLRSWWEKMLMLVYLQTFPHVDAVCSESAALIISSHIAMDGNTFALV